MKAEQFSSYGIRAALEEITRRNFNAAEARLAETMKPAQIAPWSYGQGPSAPAEQSQIGSPAHS